MVIKNQNILLIVMDTVRRDRLSIYGYDNEVCPSLEELSKEALVLEHAISPAPWTLPVHASLFTGLYPSEPFTDSNNNGKRDSGSSLKSYVTLFTQTDFLLWARNVSSIKLYYKNVFFSF